MVFVQFRISPAPCKPLRIHAVPASPISHGALQLKTTTKSLVTSYSKMHRGFAISSRIVLGGTAGCMSVKARVASQNPGSSIAGQNVDDGPPNPSGGSLPNPPQPSGPAPRATPTGWPSSLGDSIDQHFLQGSLRQPTACFPSFPGRVLVTFEPQRRHRAFRRQFHLDSQFHQRQPPNTPELPQNKCGDWFVGGHACTALQRSPCLIRKSGGYSTCHWSNSALIPLIIVRFSNVCSIRWDRDGSSSMEDEVRKSCPCSRDSIFLAHSPYEVLRGPSWHCCSPFSRRLGCDWGATGSSLRLGVP
ncbi:hypothetical protein F5144DRAFT_58708 [Chaetomium tenue]|uniref:Uncharacterized protein n=1 Tax=Chaetomium tenue TaxID=1854479 RepID=A0ACB7PT90_9PEZI|nr:hypothetical protein F5144DRAFT_58708 [Chaetomium globosum]